MPVEDTRRRSRLLTAAALTAAAVVLTAHLMVPPIVGLADNGDFERISLPAGLAPESAEFGDRFFGWMQPRFLRAPRTADPSAYRTSELPLVEIASGAGRLLAPGPRFDIRFLGALHAGLLLLALGLLVGTCSGLSAAAQAGAAALLVFVFTDPGYVAPFQSLYSQTASLLFLLLLTAVAAEAVRRGTLAGAALAAYFLCAALFVLSKPQETVQALLIGPFGVRLAWSGSRRTRAIAVLLALALAALGWRYYRSAQNSIGWVTRYNMLFMKIIPSSSDPQRDLRELGLDPALAQFAGVAPWGPDSPTRDPAIQWFFDPRSGRPSPRLLYFRHPERLVAVLARTLESASALQPEDLGNFAKESGAPPLTKARGAWSDLRLRLFPLFWPPALLGATLAACAAGYRRATLRGRRFREGLAILVAMAAGAFLVVTLGDGVETRRHLYTFHALCDLILVADLAWIVQAAAMRRTAVRAA